MNYSTYDLGCAAYLMAKGFPVAEIKSEFANNKRKSFHFANEAEPEARAYWKDETVINPRKYMLAIRELKSIIYNQDEK